MSTTIRWYGRQVQDKITNHIERILDWGRINIEKEAKKLIGKRAGKGSRSKPGQPPFRQTGHLINSITSERKGLVARIGSTLKPGESWIKLKSGEKKIQTGAKHSYALYLELGTSRISKRPYLKPALHKWIGKIRQKLKMKGR